VSGEFPLIGREGELARVREAIRNRRSLSILGSPGSGKSRLIESACAELPGGAPPVRIQCPAHAHELLVALARALLKDGHETLAATLKCSDAAVDRETSLHLRGVLWQSLALEPRPLVFEDIQGASAPMYRFLQRLYHTAGIGMIATAVSAERLGFLRRLFWDPRERLELEPLRDRDTRRLASLAASRFCLPDEIDRQELQQRVLEAAAGNPGRIVEMYRMAADSRYRRGDYVKMGLIRIDLAARFTA
jgi:hypothetical protein